MMFLALLIVTKFVVATNLSSSGTNRRNLIFNIDQLFVETSDAIRFGSNKQRLYPQFSLTTSEISVRATLDDEDAFGHCRKYCSS
uniref:Secreted protein n=2 Tax=Bursaphelenchus xylophilus TaxID=6326 RepID=A0A1I7SKN2_BURXY